MADERRIFPIETVLSFINGKDGSATDEIASFILGRDVPCATCRKAAAPLACAWLARWQPKINDMDWKEDENWETYVRKAQASLGSHISLAPMTGKTKKLVDQVLDDLADVNTALVRQTDAAMKLERKVQELEPLAGAIQESVKKCDKLEEQLKKLKADLGASQRTVLQYQGKIALDSNELMQTLKDAIKDGMKGLTVAAGAAAASDSAPVEAEAPQAESAAPAEEFGFGTSSSTSDGFGF